jgi:hypothetical protein
MSLLRVPVSKFTLKLCFICFEQFSYFLLEFSNITNIIIVLTSIFVACQFLILKIYSNILHNKVNCQRKI